MTASHQKDRQKALLALLPRLAEASVLVAGDVMLDRYWFSAVERISPEAPVPVARVERREERLGGAANVACNITALQARAGLVSVTGADEAGAELLKLLAQHQIAPYIVCDDRLTTTVKLRVIARNQQLLRLDFENVPSHEILAQKLKDFQDVLPKYQAVVLSDYGKGGLTHIAKMIASAKKLNIPILIDPKGSDYKRYKGATMMTPNVAELQLVVGAWQNEQELEERAQNLRASLHMEAILLTRSEQGMTLFNDAGVFSVPAKALEVYDVSGAGDTVIAVMALAMACHFSLIEAMTIANHAAGVVVGKFGTATLSQDELKAALQH